MGRWEPKSSAGLPVGFKASPFTRGGKQIPISTADKFGEAMLRSIPLLPAHAQEQVRAMLTPTSLAIITGTLVVWAGSHFIGIGEIVDIILLGVGFITIGFGVKDGAEELIEFATTAMDAQNDADLDIAAHHFARAVNILGITTISAILLKKSAKSVTSRGMPKYRGMEKVGIPPPAGLPPRITRPYTLPNGVLGATDEWGNMIVTRNQTMIGQRLTLYHELVHSYLSPKLGPLRVIRARFAMSAYVRSALMQYLEEALAETYAQLKVHGLGNTMEGIRFPIKEGYITISQMASEGLAIGNIIIEGERFTVYIQKGGAL